MKYVSKVEDESFLLGCIASMQRKYAVEVVHGAVFPAVAYGFFDRYNTMMWQYFSWQKNRQEKSAQKKCGRGIMTQQSFFYTFTFYPHEKRGWSLKNRVIHRFIHNIHRNEQAFLWKNGNGKQTVVL